MTKEDHANHLKLLEGMKASLRLSINQCQNTIEAAQESVDRFRKMEVEFKDKLQEFWSLDIQSLEDFRKLKSNYLNVKGYLLLQSNKIANAFNEQKAFEAEARKIDKEIESLEGIVGKKGLVCLFKNEQKEES